MENPYVAADNNLAERHARVIKGKTNQSVSLRSFDHLVDYCDCLSVMESIRKSNGKSLYEEIKNSINNFTTFGRWVQDDRKEKMLEKLLEKLRKFVDLVFCESGRGDNSSALRQVTPPARL